MCRTPQEAVFGGELARPPPAANGDTNRVLGQAGGSHPGLFGRLQQLGTSGGSSRDVLGGEAPSRGAFQPPEASAPGGDSPVVRPWPRLGTGAFVSSPLGGGGRGSAGRPGAGHHGRSRPGSDHAAARLGLAGRLGGGEPLSLDVDGRCRWQRGGSCR